MNSRAFATILSATCLSFIATEHAQTPSVSKQNQTVVVNNGNVTQNNYSVKLELKARAKQETGDERGWLRLLTPGTKPLPEWASKAIKECASPPFLPQKLPHPAREPLNVVLGDGLAAQCDEMKCVIVMGTQPNSDSQELLSVERKGTSLLLNAMIFDEDGKIIAVLNHDVPHINLNNIFDWQRPDAHTLSLTDQKNRQVLFVHYLNPTAIYVEGIFYKNGGASVEVSPKGLNVYRSGSRIPITSFVEGCVDVSGDVLHF